MDKLSDFMQSSVLATLPLPLRICAVTDGSITYLLESIFGSSVKVVTLCQQLVDADEDICRLLGVEAGDPVNVREVTLGIKGVVYVFAKSLSPVSRMPENMREQLMRADIPIGKILRSNKLETRRDILRIERRENSDYFNCPVFSREYVIIHQAEVLMWINEVFPIDSRWEIIS